MSWSQHQGFNSPNPSVLNYFFCKQPHLCDSWHWEEFALNIHKVSCFSDLSLKFLCPCAYGRNQWDFWWSETSAHLSDRSCLHLYCLCSAFILWFLELDTTILCWWLSQPRVLLLYPRLNQEWAPGESENVLFPLVASQAEGAYRSLQARPPSASSICSSQSMMHSLKRTMALRQHFETLKIVAWKQSPLSILEWKALKRTVELSTHATIFSTILEKGVNSFCLEMAAYTHALKEKEWEDERKRKEYRKNVGEREGGEVKKRKEKLRVSCIYLNGRKASGSSL